MLESLPTNNLIGIHKNYECLFILTNILIFITILKYLFRYILVLKKHIYVILCKYPVKKLKFGAQYNIIFY